VGADAEDLVGDRALQPVVDLEVENAGNAGSDGDAANPDRSALAIISALGAGST